MSHPIGTLLQMGVRRFLTIGAGYCWEIGTGKTMHVRDWMTPVPCPPNVTESPTVPDWASDIPLGGMALDKPA